MLTASSNTQYHIYYASTGTDTEQLQQTTGQTRQLTGENQAC